MNKTRTKAFRKNTIVFCVNDSEKRALDNYMKRYKITNRSHFIRQTLFKNILKRFSDDSPTLFDNL